MKYDSWLSLSGVHQAVRVSITDILGQPAVGGGRVLLRGEVFAQQPEAADIPLWLQLDLVRAADGAWLGRAVPTGDDPMIVSSNGSRHAEFAAYLTRSQFVELDERHRTDDAGPTIRLTFRGWAARRDRFDLLAGTIGDMPTTLSDWTKVVEGAGLRKVLLIELDAPDVTRAPHLDAAIRYFRDAQRSSGEGRYRDAVESLRQALNAIVGKPGMADDTSESLQASMTGPKEQHRYPERIERVRRTLKYLCDLGAHPETAEPTKSDAVAALHMTAALLQWYSRPPGRETS